jgi:hypothetical protein
MWLDCLDSLTPEGEMTVIIVNDQNERIEEVYRPYVGSQFSFGSPPQLPTYVVRGRRTDIKDGDRQVIRTVGGGMLEVDDGTWFDSPLEAKRKLALMLCDRIDALRVQVDGLLEEIKTLESQVQEQEGAAA